jgi:alcohol dehydrogenase (NADP+)
MAEQSGAASAVKDHVFANGDRMPMLGLGTWKSEPGEVQAAVREAINVGYRHIDSATFYGNEAEVGEAIRDAIGDGQVAREDLFITSKLWNNAHGRANVDPTLRATIDALGVDYVDLYQIHWPVSVRPDVGLPASAEDFLEVPVEETWAGFEAARDAGLTRHIGVSNFSAKKLGKLISRSKIKPEVNQVELHPLLQQPQLLAYCKSEDIHVTAYSPLGSGDRPAFLKADDAPVLLEDPVIRSIADVHDRTPAQVLLAWHLQRGVSTIPKSVKPARLRENLAAAQLVLSGAEMGQIAELDRGYRLISGDIWVLDGGPWTMQTLWDE